MRIRLIDLVDVLVYLVVLGLFIQFFPEVISETFLLALLTAILLKIVLELVLLLKNAIVGRLKTARGVAGRIIAIVMLILVLPGSKFLVLELVDLVFGDAVRLGGFVQVALLIVVLMLARRAVRALFDRPESSTR